MTPRTSSAICAISPGACRACAANGYVTHDGRLGIVPTEAGTRVGALTLRRQRLAERLLVDCLKVPWKLAATEACRLEHAISPLVEHYLAAFIGHPTTCPHGHPIPNEDGTFWRHEGAVELSELELETEARVFEVRHDMPELLKFLAEIGLRPDAMVAVKQRDRIAGLATLDIAGNERTVSLQLASAILVGDPRSVLERN